MNKKLFALLIILIVVFSGSSDLVLARNYRIENIPAISAIPTIEDISEIDGIYNVPGRADLRVRVFVYKAKPGQPSTPALQCNLADPDSTATVSEAGWKLPANFIYNLNLSNVPVLVGSANWPLIAENSFNAWEDAISNKVNVNRGADTTVYRKKLDGKNIVAWGTASVSALGVTYIWYNPSTMQVVELDTIMNKRFAWAWSGNSTCAYTNSYDAQNILTHEIGHWFGLDDHYTSNYINNTMYGYGSKMEVKKNTLTTGDISGVQAIY
jgi:hypothetical protein